jgi:hypothetical protein
MVERLSRQTAGQWHLVEASKQWVMSDITNADAAGKPDRDPPYLT